MKNVVKQLTTNMVVFFMEKSKCDKKATYTNGSNFFCRKHSKMGRFVIRNGDVGEILARFDTEIELRENIVNFAGMIMQKITPSSRRDIH